MKIAYVFKTSMASTYQLSSMILPQLENDTHMVNVVGMFFFDDNLFCLKENDPVGERLAKVAKEKNMLLMVCDQCAGSPKALLNNAAVVKSRPKGWSKALLQGAFRSYMPLSDQIPLIKSLPSKKSKFRFAFLLFFEVEFGFRKDCSRPILKFLVRHFAYT